MGFRFIHTADWQIGKVFRFVDGAEMGGLQLARLEAITSIGNLAEEHDVRHVMVAGDVYDHATPSPHTRNQVVERMRAHSSAQWHLLPGNHDPYQPWTLGPAPKARLAWQHPRAYRIGRHNYRARCRSPAPGPSPASPYAQRPHRLDGRSCQRSRPDSHRAGTWCRLWFRLHSEGNLQCWLSQTADGQEVPYGNS